MLKLFFFWPPFRLPLSLSFSQKKKKRTLSSHRGRVPRRGDDELPRHETAADGGNGEEGPLCRSHDEEERRRGLGAAAVVPAPSSASSAEAPPARVQRPLLPRRGPDQRGPRALLLRWVSMLAPLFRKARVLQRVEPGVGVVLLVGAKVVCGVAGLVPRPLPQDRIRECAVDIQRDAGVVAQAGALGELGGGQMSGSVVALEVSRSRPVGVVAVELASFPVVEGGGDGSGSPKGARGRPAPVIDEGEVDDLSPVASSSSSSSRGSGSGGIGR